MIVWKQIGPANENGKNNSNQDSSNLNQDDEDAANRKLQLVVEKTVDRADRGMQDLRNIRKFSNAAQMMGTRKEILHSFYRKRIFTSGHGLCLSLPTEEAFWHLCLKRLQDTKCYLILNL